MWVLLICIHCRVSCYILTITALRLRLVRCFYETLLHLGIARTSSALLSTFATLLKVSPLRGDLQKTPKEYFFESVYLTRWDVFTWNDLLGFENFAA